MRQRVTLQNVEYVIFFLLILFLPTQFGKHFWPSFTLVEGLRIDYLSPTLYFSDLLVMCLFLFQKKHFPLSFFQKKLFLLFFLSLILGTVFAQSQMAAVYGLVKIIELLFFGWYIKTLVTTKAAEYKLLTYGVMLGSLFESLLGIFQFFTKGSLQGIFYFFGERLFTSNTPGIANASINGMLFLRPYGTFPHPNVLSFYLFFAIVILFFSLTRKNRLHFGITIGVLIINILALCLTFSRVTLLFSLAVFLLLLFARVKKQIGAVLILVLCLFIVFSFQTPLVQRFLGTSLFEESIVVREQLIAATFEIIKTHPFFGVGLQNFYTVLSQETKMHTFLSLQPVHNIFLFLLAGIGIIGFIPVVYFLFKTGRYIVKVKTVKTLRIILFSSILFLGLFDHYFLTLQQGQLLTALILGLCWMKDSKVVTKRSTV